MTVRQLTIWSIKDSKSGGCSGNNSRMIWPWLRACMPCTKLIRDYGPFWCRSSPLNISHISWECSGESHCSKKSCQHTGGKFDAEGLSSTTLVWFSHEAWMGGGESQGMLCESTALRLAKPLSSSRYLQPGDLRTNEEFKHPLNALHRHRCEAGT